MAGSAQETFDTGLRKTIAWYMNNGDWWQPLRAARYAGQRLGTVKALMRILVTGRNGQVATALLERGAEGAGVEVIAAGRPELDLENPASVDAAIAVARPDLVVNAAAYTAVDKAEQEPEQGLCRQPRRRGSCRRGCSATGRAASFICRRTMSIRATSRRPMWRAMRRGRSASMANRSSRARRRSGPRIHRRSSCAPHGSTARSAPISSRPCCASARIARC